MKRKTTKAGGAKTSKGTSGGKRAARSRKRGAVAPRGGDGSQPSPPAEATQGAPDRPKLKVEVVWGDITKAEGDVHFVGHYMGVLPQKAEGALDRAMSCDAGGDSGQKGIIREWTKRGLLRGALGEITFFPWDPDRLIGVAGMGRPGTFTRPQLKILARSIARSVGLLPHRHTVSTVLIGAGSGNMRLKDAAQTLVEGVAEALKEDPSLVLNKLRVVERYLDRATDILDVLKKHTSEEDLHMELNPQVVAGEGGEVSPEFSCSLLLASLADSADDGTSGLFQLLEKLPPEGVIPQRAREKFEKVRKECQAVEGEERVRRLAMCLRLREDDEDDSNPDTIPARVAFWTDGDDVHAAAITNTVTVTERTIAGRMGLVKQAIERLMDPPMEQPKEQLEESADTLSRLLVHTDVKDILGRSDSLVVEVDAKLAPVQWEMLPSAADGKPLGVARSVARQLRTSYSPRLDDMHFRRGLKALIIGDPGDPDHGHSLEHARQEALEVHELFKQYGITPDVLIGAPQDGTNAGPYLIERGIPAADYFEVVRLLLRKDYDIVHYCGHAQFDPKAPERAGWVFKGGVLTARELEGMEHPPSLVVANACVTALLAQSTDPAGTPAGLPTGQQPAGQFAGQPAGQPTTPRRKNYPGLVASLAEEFFRRGVADYVGTAWEVFSGPASEFATILYTKLLEGETLGEAVKLARVHLYEHSDEYGAVWAAYQHYGDPTRTFATRGRYVKQ